MLFALYKVHNDQLLDLSLRYYTPYNSSPLASTDAITKLQGFMPFIYFANSVGLSRQCSKGRKVPSKSYPEASSGRGQARKESRGHTYLPQTTWSPTQYQQSAQSLTNMAQGVLYDCSSDFTKHNIHCGGQQ